MRTTTRYGATAVVALFCLLFASGCAKRTQSPGAVRLRPADEATENAASELRSALADHQSRFESTLHRLSDPPRGKRTPRELRKEILLWTDRTLNQIQEAYDPNDPGRSLVKVWTLTAHTRAFLESSEGARLFGDSQKVAVADMADLEAQIESVASEAFRPEHFEAAKTQITDSVKKEMKATAAGTVPMWGEHGISALSSVASIPLAPFRAISGINEGAGTLRDFSTTADRFTNVVENLPEEARLQLEILLLQLGESDTITSAMVNLDRITTETNRAVTVAEQLPERIGKETRQVLAEVEAKQPAISAMAADLRGAAAETGRVAAQANEAIRSATEAARAWQATADSVGAASRDLNALVNPPQGPLEKEPGKPFDINDLTKAALAITSGTRELRRLVADVENLSRSGTLTTVVDQAALKTQETLQNTNRDARSLIDLVTWRAAQILFLAFLLAAGYRVLQYALKQRTTPM